MNMKEGFEKHHHHWHKIEKRLKDILDPKLDIKFIYRPIRRKTGHNCYLIGYFDVVLKDEIIWNYPYNSKTPQYEVLRCCDSFSHPIDSIIQYLDTPQKDLIWNFQDIVGIDDILKTCDRRNGYKRLKEYSSNLNDAALKIFNTRFSDKILKNLGKEDVTTE